MERNPRPRRPAVEPNNRCCRSHQRLAVVGLCLLAPGCRWGPVIAKNVRRSTRVPNRRTRGGVFAQPGQKDHRSPRSPPTEGLDGGAGSDLDHERFMRRGVAPGRAEITRAGVTVASNTERQAQQWRKGHRCNREERAWHSDLVRLPADAQGRKRAGRVEAPHLESMYLAVSRLKRRLECGDQRPPPGTAEFGDRFRMPGDALRSPPWLVPYGAMSVWRLCRFL